MLDIEILNNVMMYNKYQNLETINLKRSFKLIIYNKFISNIILVIY